MWILNNDTNRWSRNTDTLSITNFESLKQDLKSLRFYQKVLSGSTFVTLNNLEDAYEILTNRTFKNYNYTTFLSPYINQYAGSINYEVPILGTPSQGDLLNKFLPEYGLTLKNLFTPTRLIESQYKNLLYVDVATNERYENLTQKRTNFVIDSVTLREGHRVLVKDQTTIVTLPSSTNPDTYFAGYYEVLDEVGTNISYTVWTNENGIYTYTNQQLVRANDLDEYENLIKYSIAVKLGTSNRETQWSLNRLTSGFFPEYQKNEPVYFSEKRNYVLRNRMDYNNLYELVLNDTIKHGTQSVTINDVVYNIPERTISVGEFGVIINYQGGYANIINSKYKTTLRSIEETSKHYWICGDDGMLLKMNKTDLKVTKVQLKEDLIPPKPGIPKDPRIYQNDGTVITTLNSVSFYNDLSGVVVGKFNQMWITDNGGENWKRINLVDFDKFNYNVALYQNIDRFYVGGDNGVFLDLFFESGNWTAFKRRVSKFVTADDEYLLVDDITDFEYFSATSSFYSGTQSFLAISSTNNNLYLYDISSSVNTSGNFVHLGTSLTFSDIKSITYRNPSIYFSTFEKIYRVEPFSATFSNSESNILESQFFDFYTQSGINKIINYNDTELIFTGNESLWKTSNYNSNPTVVDVYDNTFFNKLKPRLLFMNYDQGSKLNWFDDFGQYRLPERFLIPVTYLVDPAAVSSTSIAFRQNSNEIYDSGSQSYLETNWITYWKDGLKTFEYYTHLNDGFKVEPSFEFNSSESLSGVFTYSSSNITINYSHIQPLMPSRTSRYREGLTAITAPAVVRSLYFYDFLGIWQVTIPSTDDPPKKGDVIYIESDVVTGRFIINKVFSVATGGGSTRHYQYFFTDFNENIINNLNDTSYISVTNLNKYPNTTGGVYEFSETFIGTGYNQGSYKNLSSEVSSGGGYFATFDVQINGAGEVTSIAVNEPGYKYSVGDTITILTTNQIGGSSNIVLTVTNLNLNSLFLDNFKKHYISYGYEIEVIQDDYPVPVASPLGVTQSFQITGKYSQFSAYYNLQANIQVLNTSGYLIEDDIRYKTPFLNFGYTPTYNLLSYLNFVDPEVFNPSKEFLVLPKYDDIPGPDSGISDTTVVNDNLIYVDFVSNPYSGELESNKLFFGLNLKPIWDSFLLWTFVDVTIKEGIGYPPVGAILHNTPRLLIIDKYYDDTTYTEPYYVIVFHDKLSGSNDISSINIHSRRTLRQISEDLQYMNNIQRPYSDSEGNIWSESEIEPGFTYTNYESPIKFKIPTDSYTKALTADVDIIERISGIVYTDFEGNLAIQITKLDVEKELDVTILFESINGLYQIGFAEKHGLSTGDGINIKTATASVPNHTEYIGFQTVTRIDDYYVEVNSVPFAGALPSDNLVAEIISKDSFLNFQPIDIFDLGVGDKKVKQSVEITTEMWDLVGRKYRIFDLDFNKFRFRLIDGLDLEQLTDKFFWVLDAEVSNAIIGIDQNQNLIWYKGIWEGGRWFGGTWISGTWKSGDWYDGVWTSKQITDKILSVKVDNLRTDEFNSTWYGGRWFGGSWENGSWYSGRWYGGTWNNGRWFDGTWNDGTWNNGIFSGGTWVLGNWYNGYFNTDSSLSYWLDGKFNGGDFENGIWYDGEFNEVGGKKSRFGTKSFNSRNSVWHGGKFLAGEFHSFLNINDQGLPDVSEIHKYSKWYTGVFSGGVFYGGDAYSINFNSSLWQGGISNDIDIIRINTDDNRFTLDGVYRYNIGDIFYVVDNLVTGTYSDFGSTNLPRKYVVLDTNIDEDANTTEVFVDLLLENTMSVDTGIVNDIGLKCVSSFKNSTWNSGIWFNGVFDEGYYNGGIWYNGWFNGIWG